MPNGPGILGAVYPHLELTFLDAAGKKQAPVTGGILRIKVPSALQMRSFPDGALVSDADGWVGTGDIGRILPNGLLKLEGRVSGMINLGDNKRAPELFETLLLGMEGLKEVVAFRIATANAIDEVGVALVAEPEFDSEEAEARLRSEHGPWVALHVFALNALPLTPAGKIDRKGLTEHYSPQSALSANTHLFRTDRRTS